MSELLRLLSSIVTSCMNASVGFSGLERLSLSIPWISGIRASPSRWRRLQGTMTTPRTNPETQKYRTPRAPLLSQLSIPGSRPQYNLQTSAPRTIKTTLRIPLQQSPMDVLVESQSSPLSTELQSRPFQRTAASKRRHAEALYPLRALKTGDWCRS